MRSGVVAVAALAVVLGGCGVFGRKPAAIAPLPGATQDGIASWYGPGFHGRRTSSGEIYDQYDLTAAHQTLPHGTWVRVTNLTNRREVLVRINDRGPFVDDRVIDLSYAAAAQLAMIGPGTAPVQIEVVPPAAVAAARAAGLQAEAPPAVVPVAAVAAAPAPAAPPAPEAVARAAAPAHESSEPAAYAVQVGAFTEYAHARRVQRNLESRGAAARLGLVEEGGMRYYRLRLGPFGEREQAVRAARRVNDLGFPALVVGAAR